MLCLKSCPSEACPNHPFRAVDATRPNHVLVSPNAIAATEWAMIGAS